MRRLAVLILMCIAALLAACGGADDEAATPAPPPGTAVNQVGGTVTGLAGSVKLRSNGVEITLTANGSFSATVTRGIAYDIEVVTHPDGQTCTVTNGKGTVTADVDNIAVTCADNAPGTPSVPSGFTLTHGVKSLQFTWDAPAGAASYEVTEDPDGAGPLASSVIGTASAASLGHYLGALLHQRVDARYAVRACNAGGCSAYSAAATPQADAAVGYFKSSFPRAGQVFGAAIALSGDGSTMAVGVPDDSSNATGIGGDPANTLAASSGAVYVYAKAGTSWALQAYVKAGNAGAGDRFGAAVSLSADGSTLAVGATDERGDSPGVNGPDNDNLWQPGAAYVFTRLGSTWAQQAYVKATLPRGGDYFGGALALSADGLTLAVGASSDEARLTGTFAAVPGAAVFEGGVDHGAVHVYAFAGGAWVPQAYLKASNMDETSFVGFQFGKALALSADGSVLAASAVNEGSSATGVGGNQADRGAPGAGAVYVFSRAGGAWSQQAYVKASNTDAFDGFGQAVGVSADGRTLAVSAVNEAGNGSGGPFDNSAAAAGAAYVFTHDGATWSQQAYLKPSVAANGNWFGISLALSADGRTIAAGASSEDRGGTGVSADSLAASTVSNSGAAYVFRLSGGSWAQERYLKATNTGAGDRFGSTISLSGDGGTLAVGAPVERSNASGIGNSASGDRSMNAAGAVFLY